MKQGMHGTFSKILNISRKKCILRYLKVTVTKTQYNNLTSYEKIESKMFNDRYYET